LFEGLVLIAMDEPPSTQIELRQSRSQFTAGTQPGSRLASFESNPPRGWKLCRREKIANKFCGGGLGQKGTL